MHQFEYFFIFNKRKINKKKKQSKTEWHRVVLFGKQAENAAKYTSKGSKVYVEGKLQTKMWEDKEGNKRYTTEVLASNGGMQFLSSNKDANLAYEKADKMALNENVEVKTDANYANEDIPF